MEKYYTSEKNTQILIALMKAHGVRKIVASPGTTNICLVGSLQHDPYFEVYSSAEERSAAYMACGLAAETGEPVALSCTGATASRNYVPGLTEAYYRKLPVLAITSTQHMGRIGHNMPQVIDRTTPLNDIVKMSIQIPTIHDEEDAWACETAINKALLELRHRGGGPVHINLTTNYSPDFSVRELPAVRAIKRYATGDCLPELPAGKIGIFVGAHQKWDDELIKAVENFCAMYNGVVLCDATSNYKGKNAVFACLVSSQVQHVAACRHMQLMIHIGDVSGAYMSLNPEKVWRVNPDGELRDTFRKLTDIFEMKEIDFFRYYAEKKSGSEQQNTYFKEWKDACERTLSLVPELPFSNAWIAQQTISKFPNGSVLHLGILNTLRTWNYFPTPENVYSYSNTGGFGIDGLVSTLLGATLGNPETLFFGVIGDLAFFYDMNAVGNRHVGNNFRLMVINNGRGTEFRNYNHPAARFGEDADAYMAAAGHYGNQSGELLKHYAQDLGFEYLCASDKETYLEASKRFLCPEKLDRPILFEVFTDSENESEAIRIMSNLETTVKGTAKQAVKDILGDKGVQAVRKIIKR